MYAPPPFAIDNNQEITSFIQHHPFATFITSGTEWPAATHIPLLLSQKDDKIILEGHLALANPQARHLQNGTNALATFLGPHAYISSSWYSHHNVSTWNYQAVHAYGKISLLEGDAFYESLHRLTTHFEQGQQQPKYLESLPDKMVRSFMKEIVGFVLEISEWKAAYKLSQNRSSNDYANFIHQLQTDTNEESKAVADQMKKLR